MPKILRRIARLLHRPQHQKGDGLLFGLALNLHEEILEVARLQRRQRRAKAVPEPLNEIFELAHLHHIGLFMNPVQRGCVLRLEMRCHRLVRQQHELFNETVRDVPVQGDDGFDASAFAHDDFGFVDIEVDGSAAAARGVQDGEQLAHQLEHRDERRVLREQRGILVGQDPVHAGVGHPLVAVDDAVVHLIAHDLPLRVDFHQARLHQPIHMRIQAAQSRRQL